MRSLGFSVAALALMASSGTAFAAGESGKVMSTTRTVTSSAPTVSLPTLPAVQSSAQSSTWSGALNAPGGLSSYRSPFRGFILPSYWMQPNFYIDDYARYGFAAPQDDFGWSRYFEDAVLTDSTGRVVDVVKDVDWNKFGNGQFASGAGASFEDGDFDRRRPDARDFDRDRKRGGIGRAIGSIGGALIGGAVGAVAGNLIAGKGERLAGSLIGGGVGALAGLAIGEATRGGKHGRKDRYRHDRRGPHWGGGYYDRDYYGHGGYETFTTVNYIPVAPITTTTTTTRVIEEVISTGHTYRPKRPYRRPAHRQCTCHR